MIAALTTMIGTMVAPFLIRRSEVKVACDNRRREELIEIIPDVIVKSIRGANPNATGDQLADSSVGAREARRPFQRRRRADCCDRARGVAGRRGQSGPERADETRWQGIVDTPAVGAWRDDRGLGYRDVRTRYGREGHTARSSGAMTCAPGQPTLGPRRKAIRLCERGRLPAPRAASRNDGPEVAVGVHDAAPVGEHILADQVHSLIGTLPSWTNHRSHPTRLGG